MAERMTIPKTKESKQQLYNEALLFSFQHWVDELDCSKSFARQRITDSFNEVLGICLKEKNAHWTILFRKAHVKSESDYWEFGVVAGIKIEKFIWIKVRPDLAEKLFEKYSLKTLL